MADLEDPKQDPELTQQLILVQLMRNYDVMMSLLSHFDDNRAEQIQNIHDSGKLLTDVPWLQQSSSD